MADDASFLPDDADWASALSVDASGLICPLPVLRAVKGLKTLAPGQLLALIATDGGAERDVPALCRSAGHALVATRRDGGAYCFLIRKGDVPSG